LLLRTDEPALETFNPTLAPSLQLGMMRPRAIASDPIFYPAAEQLTFTLQTPIISPLIIVPERNVFIAGQAPVLRRSTNERPLPIEGSMTLSGGAPDVFTAPLAEPGAGTITLSTEVPSISWSVQVGKGRILSAGYAPDRTDFGTDFPVDMIRRRIRLESNDPVVVNVGFTVPVVGNETLSTTGLEPGVDLDTDAAPVARIGALALALTTPEIFVTKKVNPGVERLTLTGRGGTVFEKRFRIYGARTRFISLSTRYSLEVLYR
jgi:hypothetical protein